MKGPKMSFLLHFLVLFSVTAFFAEAAKEAEEGSYSANYDPQWARINTPVSSLLRDPEHFKSIPSKNRSGNVNFKCRC